MYTICACHNKLILFLSNTPKRDFFQKSKWTRPSFLKSKRKRSRRDGTALSETSKSVKILKITPQHSKTNNQTILPILNLRNTVRIVPKINPNYKLKRKR